MFSPEQARRFYDRFGKKQASQSLVPLEDSSCDRFISNYILDLLPPEQILRYHPTLNTPKQR